MTDGRVERDGDTAVRPLQRWSPAVHAALRHLRDAGFAEAPEPLRLNATTEMVSWVDGDAGPVGWSGVIPDSGLEAMAHLLRRLHSAGEGFVLRDDLTWADPAAPHHGGTLCHGDFGPWNIAWRDGEPIGVIDWDFVHLGDPMSDVVYALEYVAPFRSDEEAMRWLRHPGPPDRARRIDVFWRAYSGSTGPSPLADLVDGVIAQQRATNALAARLADEGVEPQATWFRDGHGAELAQRLDWSERNRDAIIAGRAMR